ncbi:MAG: NADH-quinone oxidoreductase subunit L [Candidatus Sumerlaeia bacterium]
MSDIFSTAYLIPLLPGLAALVTGLLGARLGRAAHWPALLAMAGAFVVSALIFAGLQGDPGPHHVHLWSWIVAGELNVSAGFLLDPLTGIMILFISFVGLLVFIFATGYMEGDPGYPRFFAYMSLFAMMMFILVLGDSFLMMFVGWEGVGLCSYLLIGYYMKEGWCASAGRKAFVVNRIGDFGFLIGLFLIFWTCGSLNFTDVFTVAPATFAYGGALITIVALCLFVGATGKSAQIPLMIWLPDAMAGPTPVSALIHAATMVTAGVYMVARCNVLFMLAPAAMDVVAVVGIATAFYAATSAIAQSDIKKVLAYSTVSQLGYMFVGLAVGNFAAGIFHVFTHAFFKGALFLCAGSVIHALHHEQNMFRMGGLRKYMPTTHWTYLVACLAIAGVPPFSGFFSKDEILWSAYHHGKPIVWAVGLVTAFLTAFYMFRSYFLTFGGDDSRLDPHARAHLHESPARMTIPLIILAAGALVGGFINLPAAIAHGRFSWLHHFLDPVTGAGERTVAALGHHPFPAVGDHETEVLLMIVSSLVALAGIALAWVMARGGAFLDQEARQRPLYRFSRNAWFWDWVYNQTFAQGCYELARVVLAFDQRVIDGVVNGAGRVARMCGAGLRRLQNGQVQAYVLVMLAGANAILLLAFYLIYTMR